MPIIWVTLMPKSIPQNIPDLVDLTRDELIEQLLHFPGSFKFDFSRDYLQKLGSEQLRHMLLAAYLYACGNGASGGGDRAVPHTS